MIGEFRIKSSNFVQDSTSNMLGEGEQLNTENNDTPSPRDIITSTTVLQSKIVRKERTSQKCARKQAVGLQQAAAVDRSSSVP
jgi:hypothetical protein